MGVRGGGKAGRLTRLLEKEGLEKRRLSAHPKVAMNREWVKTKAHYPEGKSGSPGKTQVRKGTRAINHPKPGVSPGD